MAKQSNTQELMLAMLGLFLVCTFSVVMYIVKNTGDVPKDTTQTSKPEENASLEKNPTVASEETSEEVEEKVPQEKGVEIAIIVAQTDIKEGEEIGAAMLKSSSWDQSRLPADAVLTKDIDLVLAKRANRLIPANMPVTRGSLVGLEIPPSPDTRDANLPPVGVKVSLPKGIRFQAVLAEEPKSLIDLVCSVNKQKRTVVKAVDAVFGAEESIEIYVPQGMAGILKAAFSKGVLKDCELVAAGTSTAKPIRFR